ncbi:MAG: transcription antitermination factor NusB [Gammaproteobacteria bacterium]|nr:transcription antitermination factor NusB [Gammaproteobacteria bacterium]
MSSSAWARRHARRALVQAVYQWQMTGADTQSVATQFEDDGTLAKADREFFREMLRGVLQGSDALDECFQPHLDRKLKELDKVELALLRLGTFELKERLEVPFRVVIDEYVELAKTFGAEDSHKYINGILDKLSNELRATERQIS